MREHYPEMTSADLTKKFNAHFSMNVTEVALKTKMQRNNIYCGRAPGDRLTNHARLWTQEELNFIRWSFKKVGIPETTRAFNKYFNLTRTENQVKVCICNHKISSGRSGCYKKGATPWNAGTKGLTGANTKSFKKGSIPPNLKPMHSERVGKSGFIEIKVNERNPYTGFPTRYKLKHRHIYEQNFGKVPAGRVVAFKDSDIRNFDPGNLIAVSRAELLLMNQFQYKKAPAEIKPSIYAVAKLTVKSRKRGLEVAR